MRPAVGLRNRCRCTRATRASLRGSARAVLVGVNICAIFMSVVVLSSGVLISSSDQSSVTLHIWNKVKQLPRYSGCTGVQFDQDTAYQTCFGTPANVLSLAGLAGLLFALVSLSAALCGSRQSLQAVAVVSGCCLLGGVSLAAAVPGLQVTAKAALAAEVATWIAAYRTPAGAAVTAGSNSTASSLAPFGGVFLDYLQTTRACCGWNSYADYPRLIGVPTSCCRLDYSTMVPVDLSCLTANASSAANAWYRVGCSGQYDDLLTRNLPELGLACALLGANTASAAVVALLTSTNKDFLRLLREAAME